jgi:hypothetical protein
MIMTTYGRGFVYDEWSRQPDTWNLPGVLCHVANSKYHTAIRRGTTLRSDITFITLVLLPIPRP